MPLDGITVKCERMITKNFAPRKWVERLAPALRKLENAQAPFLREYVWETRREVVVYGWQDNGRSAYPLNELQTLYLMAHHAKISSDQDHYAPLCAALDPVRHILRSHPTLERVVSQLIGRDEFWMEILDSGFLTSLTNLIAGLMARSSELSGDRFHTTATEIAQFLAASEEEKPVDELGELDFAYDAGLFYGLTLKESIDIADDMIMLPFELARVFLDESVVRKVAPPGAIAHKWHSIGVVAKKFRWSPVFRQTGYDGSGKIANPGPYFSRVEMFLRLLAIAHATPVLRLATSSNCINRSAGQLLGDSHSRSSNSFGRSAREFNGWNQCPELALKALEETKEILFGPNAERLPDMAPVIAWLTEALEGHGPYAPEVRFLHVAKALEWMYKLPDRGISRELQKRVSWYLGTDAESREELKQMVKKFYSERSASVHNRKRPGSTQINRVAFEKGFDIARRTLFKKLREGQPANWDDIAILSD